METVDIKAHRDGFLVTVDGQTSDALAARRIVAPFSSDPTGDPAHSQAVFRVARPRIKSVLLAIIPHLQRAGIRLIRDDEVSAALGAIKVEIRALRGALEGTLASEHFTLSAGFKRTLTAQQSEAVGRLLALPHGANFSVPGAGKTTVTLALHDVLRQRGVVSQLLVVAPRNAFRPWEEELAECYVDPPSVVRLAGGRDRIEELLAREGVGSAILLIGYQQAYFVVDLLERWLARRERLHLVLDESHRIKNPRRGAWANTVLQLASLASRRDILTGTPAPNAMEDLSTQLSFLWPHQVVIPEAELRDPAAEDKVTERLRPLYVRTTKKQLGLTRPEPTPVKVEMGRIQAEIHRLVKLRIARQIGPLTPSLERLAGVRTHVIRLLQIASNPTLVLSGATEFRLPPLDLEGEDALDDLFAQYHAYEVPPKFAYAVSVVRDRAARGKKTIIWSSFVKNLDMLQRLLKEFDPVVIHGGVPTAIDMEDPPESSREAKIDRFKSVRTCFALIANPAACSESISLHHQCDHAIYIDRTFNAASFLQSMDRIHRLGMPKNAHVTYELLVSPGTIDEVVDRRLSEKVQRLGRLLDDDALRAIDLDSSEESAVAFDAKDAEQVIAFLGERAIRER